MSSYCIQWSWISFHEYLFMTMCRYISFFKAQKNLIPPPPNKICMLYKSLKSIILAWSIIQFGVQGYKSTSSEKLGWFEREGSQAVGTQGLQTPENALWRGLLVGTRFCVLGKEVWREEERASPCWLPPRLQPNPQCHWLDNGAHDILGKLFYGFCCLWYLGLYCLSNLS